MKRYILLILLIFVLFGFSAQQKPQRKGTIEEENGVKVIKNPEEPLYGKIALEVEEDLRIGNEEDENYIFGRNIYQTVDSLGNIFVVDTSNHRVQKFDKDGNFIASYGRQGQGPGEFYYPMGIQLDKQDNIYVMGTLKLHILNRDGKFQRMIHTEKFLIAFVVVPEKHFIAHTMMWEYEEGDEKGQLIDNVEIVNPEGKILKNIARYPHKAPNPAQVFAGQAIIGEFLSPQFCFYPMKNGNSIYGYPSEYKVYMLDSSGNIILIIRKEASPVKVTSQEKKETRESFKEGVERIRKDAKIKAKFSKYKPYYHKLLSDEKNNIYVKKETKYKKGERKILFDMFNSDGICLFEIEFLNYPQEIIATIGHEIFAIKNGYVYSKMREPATAYLRILRFKIKNWDKIKEGIN